MEINDDIDKIINIFENKDLLWDNDFEQKILKDRINISYEKFMENIKIIENQYNRCLYYVNFDIENSLDKIIYENMTKFIKESNFQIKYNTMKIIDDIILYNIINDN
jgi:hypothetical protein